MTYASSTWCQAVELEMNKKQLNALQRGFAQKICKAYRTVSLTSALALSGLLPLDLRIQETANLYKAKKNISNDYLPPGKELESKVYYLDNPHPSTQTSIEFEFLETTTNEITGPCIYTDGSKIKGQVGAALTWWEDCREVNFEIFKLHSACTVFQSELYALYRATQVVMSSSDCMVNIMSDSKSSLELLRDPKTSHPLAKSIKENIGQIKAQGRDVRLFWLRAHVGTVGNERADELAKKAALTGSTQDYDHIPLSHVKNKIREESVRKWQDRYETSSTGAVTKKFLPDVAKAYHITRTTKLTPFQVQALTGHGGMAEYLYRFKLAESPGCECDPEFPETVWHIILDCPRFEAARHDLEVRIDRTLVEMDLRHILADAIIRPHFLSFVDRAFRTAARRNSTIPRPNFPSRTPALLVPVAVTDIPNQQTSPKNIAIFQLLACGEMGEPGIRIRGVALFMDENIEKLGISFCQPRARNRVRISPGLACLLNGSTSKTTMKRKSYDALPVTEVAGRSCRLVRSRNKTIVLLEWAEQTPFAQACSMLSNLGDTELPRIISVDAMVVECEKGEVIDRLGCIKASDQHEVVIYEDRGENLSFLKAPKNDQTTNINSWGHPIPDPAAFSGSERLQQKAAAERAAQQQNSSHEKQKGLLSTFLTAFNVAAHSLFRTPPKSQGPTTSGKMAKLRSNPIQGTRTRADMGQVNAPRYIPTSEPLDHFANAFFEFLAITKATSDINIRNCQNILQSFRLENENLLKVRLEESEAAIYDNDSSQVIRGKISGRYMAAFNATNGFVALDERETDRTGMPKYATPSNDSIVVIARCTKIMLDDRILERAKPFEENLEAGATSWKHWELPKIQWVNGVPGCGKTTWVVRNFEVDKDIIITTTTEAAKDLREKLAHRIGNLVQTKVRTMASVLVNGFRESEKSNRLMVDEALMNHFGAIVMAARLSDASELVLIGDVNQLPYIDRENLFKMRYTRPNLVANITQELLCTHRNPMDVAYALREIYSGIYSSARQIQSLQLKRYTDAEIPNSLQNTLFLVHTQEEKETLTRQGYGGGTGSRVLTVHEAQGLTYKSVIAIKTKGKLKLHESVSHAVVAVSRHTESFVYYADDVDDAIGRFVKRAMAASNKTIMNYNLMMAIKNRDARVIEVLASEIERAGII